MTVSLVDTGRRPGLDPPGVRIDIADPGDRVGFGAAGALTDTGSEFCARFQYSALLVRQIISETGSTGRIPGPSTWASVAVGSGFASFTP